METNFTGDTQQKLKHLGNKYVIRQVYCWFTRPLEITFLGVL